MVEGHDVGVSFFLFGGFWFGWVGEVESLDPDVAKLDGVVVALKFDGAGFGAFFLSGAGFVFERVVVVDEGVVVEDGDAGGLGAFAVFEAGGAEDDVEGLPFSGGFGDELVGFLLLVEAT